MRWVGALMVAIGIWGITAREPAATTAVLVAKTDLPAHTVLTRDDVEVRWVQPGQARPDAIHDLFMGQQPTVIVPVRAGEELTEGDFAAP